MRKIILFYVIGLLSLRASANPVFIPAVYLDALSFDSENQWNISLIVHQSPDSIMISSSSGRSFYKSLTGDYRSITEDNLSTELNINPGGDSVSIIFYFKSYEDSPDSLTETIVFGDYPGALIPIPLEGQSIVRILPEIFGENYYCLRGSSGNEAGTIHGSVFDKENNRVTKGSFNLSPYPVKVGCFEDGYTINGFDVNEDGTYSAFLYAILYNLDSIQVCTHNWVGGGCDIYVSNGSLKMDSLQFIMYPDSSEEQDIHLLGDYSSIRDREQNTAAVLEIFPNPAFNGYFHYETGIPVKSAKCLIILFDSEGNRIWSYPVRENAGDIELPSGISDGMYILQARVNEKAIASAPLVIKRR
jgi:hypothetical protein